MRSLRSAVRFSVSNPLLLSDAVAHICPLLLYPGPGSDFPRPRVMAHIGFIYVYLIFFSLFSGSSSRILRGFLFDKLRLSCVHSK